MLVLSVKEFFIFVVILFKVVYVVGWFDVSFSFVRNLGR